MIQMTINKFYHFKDDSNDFHQLYIIEKPKNHILYIGISKIGIWNRWFGNSGRMRKNIENKFYSTDSISEKIIENMPESMNWIIKLYTIQDCILELKDELYQKYKHKDFNKFIIINDIEGMEQLFIKKLHPELNVMLN